AHAMVYSAPKFAGIKLEGVEELPVGDTATFQAYLIDEDGNPKAGPPVNWKSSEEDVATVDEYGLVTAVAEGETEIRAKAASWSASMVVSVVPAADPDGDPDSDPDQDPDQSPDSGENSARLDRAFPGAEGYGAEATLRCDRSDVQVLKVTNTNGSGPGSFYDALERNDPDRMSVVVFETGGTIRTSYRIKKGCIYIAGQTAPGDGVQIHNPDGVAFTIDRGAGSRDIVVRHLRFRSGKSQPGGPDVLTVFGGRDIILDHLSTQFGNDEVLSISPPNASGAVGIQRLTLQRSMVAVGMIPHSRGSLIVVPDKNPSIPVGELSIHHNLWAHSAGRNPSYRGVSRVEHVNNVSYNWKGNVGMADLGSEVDYVNNYFKAGPWSKPHRIIGHDTLGTLARFYARGNVADPFQTDPNANQRKLFNYRAKWTPLPDGAFVSDRRARPEIQVDVQSANRAYDSVLDDVGANGQLTCDGRWRDVRDPLDERIIDQVRRGNGPGSDHQFDNPDDFVGIPHLAQGRACSDGDGDGMPDAFEERFGLDRGENDASRDPDGDGYTNIEEYVNGTEPR
ncbi:MAG: Ig-like domain-containing protein, partial [Gemmatimonadota bacterium]|nr:Ig-like domain-containing protein [Gemmatimonadota bacterium]